MHEGFASLTADQRHVLRIIADYATETAAMSDTAELDGPTALRELASTIRVGLDMAQMARITLDKSVYHDQSRCHTITDV